ncbi:MAG: sugar phosphate isomerase/epimerase family protein [Planctomycetaceae bacterium]
MMKHPSANGIGSIDRRRFLQVSAMAGTAVLMPGLSGLAAEEKDPYGGFKMGLQSYSLRAFDLKTALSHTKMLGVHYWESFPGHLPIVAVPKLIAEQKAQLDEAGVTLMAYGVVPFDSNENAARAKFDYAKATGMTSLSADPKKDKATFDLLDKLCEEYGVAIAIHNHGPGARYDKIKDVVDIVKDRHPKIGACVDTGHYLRSDEDPVEAIAQLKDRVFGVHLKDVRTITSGGKRSKQFTILGQGELKVVECLKLLRSLNYPYCLALEYEENEKNPLSDIEVCLQTVRDAVKTLG